MDESLPEHKCLIICSLPPMTNERELIPIKDQVWATWYLLSWQWLELNAYSHGYRQKRKKGQWRKRDNLSPQIKGRHISGSKAIVRTMPTCTCMMKFDKDILSPMSDEWCMSPQKRWNLTTMETGHHVEVHNTLTAVRKWLFW
jgi:hypothetical protein